MDQPESFPELVGVLDTNDKWALGMALTSLDEAGIIYDVVNITDVPVVLKPASPDYWIPPCRILVAVEDAPEVRSLLEPLQHGPIFGDMTNSAWEEPWRKFKLAHYLDTLHNTCYRKRTSQPIRLEPS